MAADYSALRVAADSWGLLFLAAVMVGVLLWTFRPGSKDLQEEARRIPLREDEDRT